MRIRITALLSLPLMLIGLQQVQGMDMEKSSEETGMHSSDGMMKSAESMHTGEPMMSDDMKHSDGMMKSDDTMQSDDMKHDPMKQGETMMHNATMAPQHHFMVPSDAELRRRLTPLQYEVTREDGTERPFDNAYWNNHQAGIYVDVISGVPLFSSKDKYESGTGWPSFTRPLDTGNIVEKEDRSFFSVRTEVRSKLADAHLGHVFDDGPQPTGLRYCMNSAALRFIPAADLEKEGYGEYSKLFK